MEQTRSCRRGHLTRALDRQATASRPDNRTVGTSAQGHERVSFSHGRSSPRCGGRSAPRSPTRAWERACRRDWRNGSAGTEADRSSTWAENTWYSHHPPPVGGKPPKGAIPPSRDHGATHNARTSSACPGPPPRTRRPSRPSPARRCAGEGQWHPAGRLVDGLPAVYEAYLRPDAVHTSVVAGVAWMDTKLLSATLYSGSTIPGGGPWPTPRPVSARAAGTLVAAFNAGFLMSNAKGGYYTEGKTVDHTSHRRGVVRHLQRRNGHSRRSGDGT